MFRTSVPNVVILAWMGDEFGGRQAQNGVDLEFQVEFDFGGQG